jgi:hypothetical protein
VFRLTVSLSLVLGLGALSGGLILPCPLAAAPDGPAAPAAAADDGATDWNNRWDKTFKDAAKEYVKLSKQYESQLEKSSAFVRWRVLQYLPDDPETRAFLGYIKAKQADGKDGWERNDIVHDKLKEMTDLADPKATKFGKDSAETDKRVANWFKGLALKATECGAAKGALPESKWAEKAARAWERVLMVDDSAGNKLAEDAHKALGHPQFDKKYVSPFKLKFLKARADRKAAAQKLHDFVVKPCDECPIDGKFVAAGLTGAAAKTTNMVVLTTAGKDQALQLAADCERSYNDLVETYGFPESVKERSGIKRINVVKDATEFRKFLTKGEAWTDAQVNKYTDHGMGGTNIPGEFIETAPGGAVAEDAAMNITATFAVQGAQNVARADVGNTGKSAEEKVEDWLVGSIGTDITQRLLGTKLLHWGAFGKYGDEVNARPGEDKWIELARTMVLSDEDVALSRLPKLKLDNQDIKGPETVKGWAFIQFLFEKDTEKAKKFVWQAIANGTPSAVLAVYPNEESAPDIEKSMEALDEEYRQWIVKAW